MKLMKHFFLVLLLLMGAHFTEARPFTLVTLGDSLTAGDGDDGIGGGYPIRLMSKLQAASSGSALLQFGISGDTTTDLINKQLTPAVAALNAAPASNQKIALVWIGSNDFFGFYNYTITEGWCSRMGIETCENAEFGASAENVSTILAALQSTGAALYIALLDDQSKRPVITDAALRTATFPNISDEYAARMATNLSLYNSRVQTHAETYGAQTVDFFNTTIFETRVTLSDDGNHPNRAGYDAIADIWHHAVTGL